MDSFDCYWSASFFVWVSAGYALFFVLVAVGYAFWHCIKFLLVFLHFKDKKDESSEEVGIKKTTPTIAEMNPKLPPPPPDLWKN